MDKKRLQRSILKILSKALDKQNERHPEEGRVTDFVEAQLKRHVSCSGIFEGRCLKNSKL